MKLIMPILILLFCAFQCDDSRFQEPVISDPEKIVLSVNPNVSTVHVGDTIWLSGSATSKIFDYSTGDSIVSFLPLNIYISFFRLKKPVNEKDYNTVLAANEFDFYTQIGTIEKYDLSGMANPDAYAFWDNLDRIVTPELSSDSSKYKATIGIIPKSIGYFAFECSNTFKVDSFNRDLYAQFGDIYGSTFFVQGRFSSYWAPIDDRLYFFKVENNNE